MERESKKEEEGGRDVLIYCFRHLYKISGKKCDDILKGESAH